MDGTNNISGFQQRREKAADAKIQIADLEAQYKLAANKSQIGKMTTLRNEINKLQAEYKMYNININADDDESASSKQDSPIKTDTSVQDEYINSRWAALLAAHYEEKAAIKSLKSQGMDAREAKKVYREAKNKNNMSVLLPKNLKKMKSAAKVLRRTGTALSVLASTFWIWGPMVLCFGLLSFGAAMISQPTRFVGLLGKDCVEAAGDDQVAAAKCLQDAAEKNNFDAFSNQGYI